ncbi:endonuclease domain-containing protein [Sagittula salina]|uniref:DUF559 domain-containing protein n=1 Tax=Sagittula salina TaxID=2820268 RepID=A0A940MR86_9RHOB|nr:DUF559 domain-containing protein [Sagittula salina]MBP0484438.1 DUF559 domain-containing protein [Sagittula salina]
MVHRSPQIRKARILRQWATAPEEVLWQALRNRKLGGLKFRRKAPVASHVVDFLCPAARLVVEVTGLAQHRVVLENRDAALAGMGFGVLRLSREEVETDLPATLSRIERAARPRV